jgi:RNA polymerase sigma-70 factor, ECF subfamily
VKESSASERSKGVSEAMSGQEVLSSKIAGTALLKTNSTKDVRLMTPDQLLACAQNLDTQALAQIHDRFYPAVYRYVRYRLDNEQIVEDISSEVFLRLLDHLHKRKGEIHDLRAWLIGTASNLVNDHLRQKYRRPTEELEDHESLVAEDDLHGEVEQNDNQRAVQKAVQQLTREQQHVLALRFSQGMSIEETAQMMNKTIGAIKVLQFRALTSIRKLLEAGEKVR